jgi:hypothetical protein
MARNTVEIDEAEFAANRNLASLVQEMQGNPAARKLLEQAVKTVRPNARSPITEYQNETEERVMARVEARLAERDGKQADEDRQAQFRRQWEAQKAALREQGHSEETIAKIEAHAAAEGIPVLRAAALDYLKQNPPTSSGTGRWNFFEQPAEGGDEYVKSLLANKGDDGGSVDSQVQRALDGARGR